MPIITLPNYPDILDASDGYAIAVQNGRAGVIDQHNNVVVPFEYDPTPEQWRQVNETSRGIAVLREAQNQLWVFHLASGKRVNEEPFEEVHFKQYEDYRGCLLIKQAGKYGLMDYEGQWILPPKFERLSPCHKGSMGEYGGQIPGAPAYYMALLDGKAGLYRTSGEQVLPHAFIHLRVIETDGISCIAAKKQVSDELMEIRGDFYNEKTGRQEIQQQWIPTEKWGLIDFSGASIAPYAYDNILYAGKNRFVVLTNAMQYVWYGMKSEESFIRDGEAAQKIRYGLLAPDGRELLAPTLLYAGLRFNPDGFMSVRTEAGWGAIDVNGTFIVPPTNRQMAVNLRDGLFLDEVTKGSRAKSGFRNIAGEWAIPAEYDWVISHFEQGRAVLMKGKNVVVLDTSGQELFVLPDSSAEYIHQPPFLQVKMMHPEHQKRLFGIFNCQTGAFLIPAEYKAIDRNDLQESGVFIVTDSSNKKGYFDLSGKQLTPCKYTEANPFSEGMALVKADGKYGFINRAGEEVIAPAYKSACAWSGGAAIVSEGKMKRVIMELGG